MVIPYPGKMVDGTSMRRFLCVSFRVDTFMETRNVLSGEVDVQTNTVTPGLPDTN